MITTNLDQLTEIWESSLMTELRNAIRRNDHVSDRVITASWQGSANHITLTLDEITEFTIEYSEYAATLYDWDDCPVLFGTVERDKRNFEELFAIETIRVMERLA